MDLKVMIRIHKDTMMNHILIKDQSISILKKRTLLSMLEEDEDNLLTTMKEVEEILATQKDGMIDTAVIIKMPLSPMTIATAIIITMKIQCTHLTPILK